MTRGREIADTISKKLYQKFILDIRIGAICNHIKEEFTPAIDLAIEKARREVRERLKEEFNATLVLIRCLSPPQEIDDFIADQQKRIRALSEDEKEEKP